MPEDTALTSQAPVLSSRAVERPECEWRDGRKSLIRAMNAFSVDQLGSGPTGEGVASIRQVEDVVTTLL